MSRLLVLLSVFCFILGCVSEPSGTEYFAGRLSVYGDTVCLCDCATGRIHPIVKNAMCTAAVARYEKFGTESPQTIFMTCKGRLLNGKAHIPDSLHIERLLSLNSDGSDRFLLVGLYECETDSCRKTLHLKPDRTFRLTVFDHDNEHTTQGRWSQTSELELVLRSEMLPLLRFEILPNHETLTGNNTPNEETVFRKVYL